MLAYTFRIVGTKLDALVLNTSIVYVLGTPPSGGVLSSRAFFSRY